MAIAEPAQFEVERQRFEQNWPEWWKANKGRYGSNGKWANHLGTSPTAVGNWGKPLDHPDVDKRGNVPKGYFMARILETLGASYTDVLTFEPGTEAKGPYLAVVRS